MEQQRVKPAPRQRTRDGNAREGSAVEELPPPPLPPRLSDFSVAAAESRPAQSPQNGAPAEAASAISENEGTSTHAAKSPPEVVSTSHDQPSTLR